MTILSKIKDGKNYLMGKNKDIEPYTVNGFYSTFF